VAAVSAKVDKENTTIVTTPAIRPTSRLAQIQGAGTGVPIGIDRSDLIPGSRGCTDFTINDSRPAFDLELLNRDSRHV
jgi:hypothetical protein